MFSPWGDGDHLKCMVYLSPRKWRLSGCLGFASHSSGWVLLDDVHGDHFSSLFAFIVADWRIPWFLMADVNGEVTWLSEGYSPRSTNHTVGGAAAPSPALAPLDLELRPLALHSGLHLQGQRELVSEGCRLWPKQILCTWPLGLIRG